MLASFPSLWFRGEQLRKGSRGSEDASYTTGGRVTLVLHGAKPVAVAVLRHYLVHELGHALQDQLHLSLPLGGLYGSPPIISAYAETNPDEDFAESFQAFVETPRHLRRTAPEKESHMSDRMLRKQIIRLAHANPEFQKHLLPLLEIKLGTRTPVQLEKSSFPETWSYLVDAYNFFTGNYARNPKSLTLLKTHLKSVMKDAAKRIQVSMPKFDRIISDVVEIHESIEMAQENCTEFE